MTFLIAAAGTGGHVFPGLAVGEGLVAKGVDRSDILYVGGARLESKVYPSEGFPFLEVELRGLQRSLTPRNLTLPGVVFRARNRIFETIKERQVSGVLGMGGYVTIPTGLAARKAGVRFFNAEQNAEAGLANRISSRWAVATFTAFPETGGLADGQWVGNPVREPFWDFDRSRIREGALNRYQLDSSHPVLGVFGGSLGAGVLNEAISSLAVNWRGAEIQILHLTGESQHASVAAELSAANVRWVRLSFEESMENFYAAADLVVARAGGAVAELTATGTPAVLVPGSFGSSGHQARNAEFLAASGASVVIEESNLDNLVSVVEEHLFDTTRLQSMRHAALTLARPQAAQAIAEAMIGEL